MLDLEVNTITGTLPQEWSTLSALTDLRLSHNVLQGFIPTEWGVGMVADGLTVALDNNADLCGDIPPGAWVITRLSVRPFVRQHYHGSLVVGAATTR